MKKEIPAEITEKSKEIALIDENLLKRKVHTIRGEKVMLDADLAEIYGYETRAFNQQVKLNIEKFDDDFRFQLTEDEFKRLISKNLTSKSGRGGTRKMPIAFTEQGIYMLMTVLRGNIATRQSKALVRLFKEMKNYIAENQQLLGCANCAQIAALTAQNTREIAVMRSDYEILKGKTDALERKYDENRDSLAKIMENFTDPATFKHFVILDGHKFEADIAYTQIYGMAKHSIIVIDNYLDVKTLDLLRCVADGVKVTILSDQYGGCRLTPLMKADFETVRPGVLQGVKPAKNRFHDRYIVLDFGTESEKMYHCGASSKDAGGKITTIMEIENPEVYRKVIEELL